MRTGDELPPLRIPITRTLIVAGALASRDYQDVHHDAEAAKEKGSPDIFMNILTTNGLVGRYITDHFGPRARLRKVAIRLGAPNYPGDEMVLTGEVTSVAEGTAEVAVTGRNGIGHHVTGKVTVQLPTDAPGTGDARKGTTDAPGTGGARKGTTDTPATTDAPTEITTPDTPR
ncbi:MaoC family dehydratase [Streptomyces sp. NPDC020125]|uniref:MaoC family dehydratase n=1 Tax=Streptomyces sp. NPDC020125 TaxID=3154593 RepID=UPI0033C5AF37